MNDDVLKKGCELKENLEEIKTIETRLEGNQTAIQLHRDYRGFSEEMSAAISTIESELVQIALRKINALRMKFEKQFEEL